jgi:hypothetical protein
VLIAASPLTAEQTTNGTAATTDNAATLFLSESEPDAIYASDMIGMDVYSSQTDYDADYSGNKPVATDARAQWDNVGEVGDIVLSPSGKARAVLVDIGGFLGIGEQTVALDMSQLHFLRDENDDRFIAVNSSREELEKAPEYRRPEPQTAGAGLDTSQTGMTGAADTAAPDTAAMPGRPALERDGYTTANYDELTTEDLEGATVYDIQDQNIGDIEELIVSTDGKIEQAIIDVGGFLGIGEHRVALSFDEMQVMTNAKNSDVRVYVDQSRESLEQMPEYDS